MGKVYDIYAGSIDSSTIKKAKRFDIQSPYDVRTVVQNYNDLFNSTVYSRSELYLGMPVVVLETYDLYVLTKIPGKKDDFATTIQWKKVSYADADFINKLPYYQEKLGARVVDSVDDLTDSNLDTPYVGMFAVVIDDSSDSSDENGLYVLKNLPNTTASNWYRVTGGELKVNDVVTFDGSAPKAGSGFSIENEGEYIEEDYVDIKLEAGKLYTSNGINSYAENGGSKLEGVGYITLSNGGSSFIKLFSSEHSDWIQLSLTDDSLGFTKDDVRYVVNGEEVNMSSTGLVLPKGALISFTKDVQLRGMTETRGSDSTEYIFGTNPGSDYEDVDIYTPNVLPTVYAYSNNTKVRVLTEGDRADIINKISENSFRFNVENHILCLVH